MTPEPSDDPFVTPAFVSFREAISSNIGFFPPVSYDRMGFEHRTRINSAKPRASTILYSARELRRWKEISDLLRQCSSTQSSVSLSAGLAMILGGDWLLTNRLPGLVLIATGLRAHPMMWATMSETIETLIEGAARDDPSALISLFHPLAHEIGHLPAAQEYCPCEIQSQIMSDEILVTYSINYERVKHFTGEFDYRKALSNKNSPLHLDVLREELISDWFATYCMYHVIGARLRSISTYALADITGSVLSCPLIMSILRFFQSHSSVQDLQERTLALHCRYSVLIDSARAAPVVLYGFDHDESQKIVDMLVEEVNKLYWLAWNANMSVLAAVSKVEKLTKAEVWSAIRRFELTASETELFALYLSQLAQQSEMYPLSKQNREMLEMAVLEFYIRSR